MEAGSTCGSALPRMQVRRTIAAIGATAAGLLAFAVLLQHVSQRALVWQPKTIVSRTGSVPQQAEDAILTLREAEPYLAKGASVVYIRPARRTVRDDQIMYLVALGQLPRHLVLPPSVLDMPPSLKRVPDFVITYESPLQDDRFELLATLRRGTIYRLRR